MVDAEDAAAANRGKRRKGSRRSGDAEVAAGTIPGGGGGDGDGAGGEACGGGPTAEATGRRLEREARRAQAMWGGKGFVLSRTDGGTALGS